MTDELQSKVDRAVKLIQAAGKMAKEHGQPLEICYSGGKDSDVILELARMSGVEYRAIYKNTTIDPPGTIAHAKENGADVLKPKARFFELVAKIGAPGRFNRYCCRILKEYKVLDIAIMGVRKDESTRRAALYNEPTECRFYGSKKQHVEIFYPILYWSDKDVVDFIEARHIKIHPLYFREDGTIDPKRRLGCMCCPLASTNKRLAQFRERPNMVKAYIRAEQKYRDTHPDAKKTKRYADVYEWAVREFFYDKQWKFEQSKGGLFGNPDYKKLLEDYFKLKL